MIEPEEADDIWCRGYNSGYRRAIEFVRNEIKHGNPKQDIDLFLGLLVEGMLDDWTSQGG